jgi:hypothetical protein
MQAADPVAHKTWCNLKVSYPCFPAGLITANPTHRTVRVSCSKPGGGPLSAGTYSITLTANYQQPSPCNPSLRGSKTGSADVQIAATAAGPVVTLRAATTQTSVCPGVTTLTAVFTYTASNVQGVPFLQARLDSGALCTLNTGKYTHVCMLFAVAVVYRNCAPSTHLIPKTGCRSAHCSAPATCLCNTG